jgi:hypothetical protein
MINDNKPYYFQNSKSKNSETQRKHQNQKPKEAKIFDIRERTFQFALRVIKISNIKQ